MGITFHDVDQGTPEWHALRRGILTASEMKLIITPGLKVATGEKVKTHLYELLAQRVTGYVEPHFESYDMERGKFDEEHARAKYGETYGEVEEVGFITNDEFGFVIGYSPDGRVVGQNAGIEAKSRIQKWQMQTLLEYVAKDTIPPDFIIQVQTGLLVSKWDWIDFLSYSGGMHMATVRCHPIPHIQAAIVDAASVFEAQMVAARKAYDDLMASSARLVQTERLIYL